jgi:excisionase family DNA binding protein
VSFLYLTVKETAEYLSLPENTIVKLIQKKQIKALFDGENYLVNQSQFDTHLKQMEKYKELIEEYLNEPIPEDRDIKDED